MLNEGQNVGNKIGKRRSTRVSQLPGGNSTLSLGWGGGEGGDTRVERDHSVSAPAQYRGALSGGGRDGGGERHSSPARSSSSSYRVLQEPGGGSSWSPFHHDGQGSHSRFGENRRASAGSALSGQRVAPPNFLHQRNLGRRSEKGSSKLLQTAHIRAGGAAGAFRGSFDGGNDGSSGGGGGYVRGQGSRGFVQVAQETSKERMDRLKSQLAQAKAEEEIIRAQRLSLGGRNAFIDAREQEFDGTQGQNQYRQQQQQQQQQKQGSPAFISAAAAAAASSPLQDRRTSSGVSSNVFATGSSQNCGNFITDRPTTRVVAPPGGRSSGPLW